MIIEKVEFRYSQGDKVRYIKNKFHQPYRSPSTPVTEKEYTIDGYGFTLTTKGIQKWYLFHSYCDDYFEYHERVNEEWIEPISKPTLNVVENIHFKDVFDEELEIGDCVFVDVYNKHNTTTRITSLAFVKSGTISGFQYSINDTFSSKFAVMIENIEKPVKTFYNPSIVERTTNVTKTLPEKKILIEDILNGVSSDFIDYNGNFQILYQTTINGLDFLSITQSEFNKIWREVKEQKEKKKNKKNTSSKKTATKKKSKIDDVIMEKLNKLSVKEKKELLKLLES